MGLSPSSKGGNLINDSEGEGGRSVRGEAANGCKRFTIVKPLKIDKNGQTKFQEMEKTGNINFLENRKL